MRPQQSNSPPWLRLPMGNIATPPELRRPTPRLSVPVHCEPARTKNKPSTSVHHNPGASATMEPATHQATHRPPSHLTTRPFRAFLGHPFRLFPAFLPCAEVLPFSLAYCPGLQGTPLKSCALTSPPALMPSLHYIMAVLVSSAPALTRSDPPMNFGEPTLKVVSSLNVNSRG